MNGRARALGRIALLVLGAAAAMLGSEVALAALGLPAEKRSFDFLGAELDRADTFVRDDELFWKLRPGAFGGEANELGLRGHFPRGAKRPGDFRIVCVGDSCTFGSSVALEEAYGVRLERALQDRWPDRRIEVVLAGVPGYSSWQDRCLLARLVPRLLPDYAVLYCGGWNDYVAAVGASDAERARQGWAQRTRLWRLLSEPGARAHQAVRTAFLRGEAPAGRRVPLPQFEANLRAMIEMLRANGCRVCLVAPPVPPATKARHSVAADYQAAVARLARELHTDFVDGDGLLAAAEQAAAGADPAPGDESLCFHDWIHPSAHGHRLLAAALVPLAAQALPSSAVRETPPRVLGLEPGRVAALAGGSCRVRGAGLAAVERVRLGPRQVVAVHDGEQLRLSLAAPLVPGRHEVVLLGAFGRACAGTLEVDAPELTVVCAVSAGVGRLVARGVGAPGWRGAVWFAPQRRPEPVSTIAGPFALAGDPAAWHEDAGLPFPFARLSLPRLDVEVAADGTFTAARELQESELANIPAAWWAQALLYDGEDPVRACLSRCVQGTRTDR